MTENNITECFGAASQELETQIKQGTIICRISEGFGKPEGVITFLDPKKAQQQFPKNLQGSVQILVGGEFDVAASKYTDNEGAGGFLENPSPAIKQAVSTTQKVFKGLGL